MPNGQPILLEGLLLRGKPEISSLIVIRVGFVELIQSNPPQSRVITGGDSFNSLKRSPEAVFRAFATVLHFLQGSPQAP
jgi:hypothetical protein